MAVAMAWSAPAASGPILFEPGDQATFDEHQNITWDGATQTDLTGIHLDGDLEHSHLIFNQGVTISINAFKEDKNSYWAGYGITIYEGWNGPAYLDLHGKSDIEVLGVTNVGAGLMSSTTWNSASTAQQPVYTDTTMTLHDQSSVKITGTNASLAGVVAGSYYSNNSNPGGRVVFADGSHSVKVESDWTEAPSSLVWTVGMLAYENGVIDQKANVSVDVKAKNMPVSTTVNNAALRWFDTVAGLHVDSSGSYNQDQNAALDIRVTDEVDGQQTSDTNMWAQTAGIFAGYRHQNKGQDMSKVSLAGATDITMALSSIPEGDSTASAGVFAIDGANVTVKDTGALNIRFEAPDGALRDGKAPWTVYGLLAGTIPPGEKIRTDSPYRAAVITVNGSLTIAPPENYNPALTGFKAIFDSERHREGDVGGVHVDNTTSGKPVSIVGLVETEDGGWVDLNLKGAESSWTGAAVSFKKGAGAEPQVKEQDGTINIGLADGASWTVLDRVNEDLENSTLNAGDSQINSLVLTNGGTLNMQSPVGLKNYTRRTEYQTVRIWDRLKGDGGRMAFDMDLEKETLDNVATDQLIVTNEAAGKHSVDLNLMVNGDISDKFHSENWIISQGAGNGMTLSGKDDKNVFRPTGGLTAWRLAFVPEGQTDLLKTEEGRDSLGNTSTGKGDWYLVRLPDAVDPGPAPEVQDNLMIGTSTGQAMAYFADLEDLRKRIGEVRYGAQAGAWVKAFAKEEKVSHSGGTGFEQEGYGINVGLDTLVGTTEHSSWLVGGAFRYGQADQEGIGGRTLEGELEEYSVKGYATWMHESGSYADFVLQAGRYTQKLDGFDNSVHGASHAKYNTWGFGASVEAGHMFTFGDDQDDRRWFNHWFLEPQLELSYFRAMGDDYTTSTGLKVNQDDADFLTGRAGIVLGKKFNYGTVDDLDPRWFQIAVIGGVKHEFLGGDQTIRYTGTDGVSATLKADDFSGTRFYYGLNADWQVSDNVRLFAQVDREEGDGYTKSWDASLGFKYMF